MTIAEALSCLLPDRIRPEAWFLSYELSALRNGQRVPLSACLRLWGRGVSSRAYGAYDLETFRFEDFLSDVENRRASLLNGPADVALENKLLFNDLLASAFEENAVDVDGRVMNGTFFDGSTAIRDVEPMLERLDEAFVLKPFVGGMGDGIYVVTTEPTVRINGVAASDDELGRLVRSLDEYLVQERVQQAAYARSIYPRSTNTIRAVTLVDPIERVPHIVAAYHRFGTRESNCVDNLSKGGVSAWIDPDTGELGPAISYPEFVNDSFTDHHPDTERPIAGETVPAWSEIWSRIVDVADHFRQYGILVAGWDLVVTSDAGEVTILEANNTAGMLGLQTHKPLLTDRRARRFYEYYDVI